VRFRAALIGCLMVGAILAGQAQASTLRGLTRDRHRARAHAANLPYGGGPVLHENRTHVIFWQPAGSGLSFDPGYQPLIESFLRNVAFDSHSAASVYGLTGQYSDRHGPAAYASVYGRSVLATDRLPPNGCAEPPGIGPGWSVCLTDNQLQQEIEHVVRAGRLPTGPSDVYFLVTPNGLGDCASPSSASCALGGDVNGYCGYHSQTADGLVLYAVIPYNAVPGHCQSDNPRPNGSTADPAISTISHEHSEMVTDPVGNAWVDNSGNENGDLCLTSFGPNLGGSGASAWNEVIHGAHYYLQEEWSNHNGDCEPRPRPDSVSFTAAVRASRAWWLSFSARAHAPAGSIVAYHWFFGDGRTGQGRTISHRYARAGRYRIVLRTTDNWGNWALYAGNLTITSGTLTLSGL
jgi:hypothetical protein